MLILIFACVTSALISLMSKFHSQTCGQPNGRFEVGKKICLSISAHHPEEWQAAWGVRLMLEALISFLPTDGSGALGALDYTSSERKRLAEKSKEWCCTRCGKIANLIPEISEDEGEEDENETSVLPTEGFGVIEAGSIKTSGEKIQKIKRKKKKEVSKYANEIAKLHCHAIPTTPKASQKSTNKDDHGASSNPGASASDSGNINGLDSVNSNCYMPPQLSLDDSSRSSSVASSKSSTTIGQTTTEGIGEPGRETGSLQAHRIISAEEGTVKNEANSQSHQASQAPGVATRGTVGTLSAGVQGRQTGHGLSEDPLLWVAGALGIAIAAILLQKVTKLLYLT